MPFIFLQFSKSAATHKATKSALTQLTESLAEELRAAGLTSIGVHNLSPGLFPCPACSCLELTGAKIATLLF